MGVFGLHATSRGASGGECKIPKNPTPGFLCCARGLEHRTDRLRTFLKVQHPCLS